MFAARRVSLLLPLLCLVLGGPLSAAPQEVRVGAYDFPPYVSKPERRDPQGVLPDLLALLNAEQDDFHFVLVPTSNGRRYRDFRRGRFDMIFFESSGWGWEGIETRSLDMGSEDAELYVALAQEGRDQHYFDQLTDKRLALYNGYHYGFAGFDADVLSLTRSYQATITYSHDSNLLMVLHGRADVALVTRSYLQLYLDRNPGLADTFLVSQRLDQIYRHQALLRPSAPLDPDALAALLQRLRAEDRLGPLLRAYHITVTNDSKTPVRSSN
ncbi:PhnD/SsuA/transferrin family substrate-binding protein [Pseudomonas mangiferae]|uniref:Amino acid ABC transporter substrate-binding protein n=1 Tax=Pseudomonas mangiferae TaxID=2593654 RepID=A0A553H213_9PSED|nr:amino acid ABC transporter substrate-binding protein [Pseudomonas mangiferae]TRX75795.1 amino acid ABC transporter substrate-binding protein [Pseudomonas mangiferae]